jgi:NAD(P)-dependent dehydrogenase (short-subunit alcohol dehydrogenase family)
MQSLQLPLGSGFGCRSSAAQVLQGVQLSGCCALVTGGHSGLGLATTRALAGAGARVLVGARDAQAARRQLQGLANCSVMALDLAELGSVRDFAGAVLADGAHIDMLIASAGIMATPLRRTASGREAQFATNHLGHFALLNLLRPALLGGARVVLVSSAGHQQSGIRWDDIDFLQGYDKWLAYGQSKTANALCAVELDRLGQKDGIRAFSLHPGKIFTPLQRYLSAQEMMAAGWLDAQGLPADPSFKTVEQGAATQVWAATSPLLEGLGGLYCEDCDIARLDRAEVPSFVGVRAHATDPVQAERLWDLSARLTGIDGFSA